MVRRRSTVRFRKGAPRSRRSGLDYRAAGRACKIIRPSSDRRSEGPPTAPGRRDWHVMAGQTGLAARVVEHARLPLGIQSWATLLSTFRGKRAEPVAQGKAVATGAATAQPICSNGQAPCGGGLGCGEHGNRPGSRQVMSPYTFPRLGVLLYLPPAAPSVAAPSAVKGRDESVEYRTHHDGRRQRLPPVHPAGQSSESTETGPRPRSCLVHPRATSARYAHRRVSLRKEALAGPAQRLRQSDARADCGETVGRDLAGALRVSRQCPQASDHADGPCQESRSRHVQRLAGAMTDVPSRPTCFEYDDAALESPREQVCCSHRLGPVRRRQTPAESRSSVAVRGEHAQRLSAQVGQPLCHRGHPAADGSLLAGPVLDGVEERGNPFEPTCCAVGVSSGSRPTAAVAPSGRSA
jgi:hypothetical protein